MSGSGSRSTVGPVPTPDVRPALDRLAQGVDPTPGQRRAVVAALSAPPMVRRLADDVVPSTDVETLLVALRRTWLDAVTAGEVPDGPPELLAAAAMQLQATEWVYDETDREREQVAALQRRLRAAPPWHATAAAPEVTVAAMYRPLGPVVGDRPLPALVDRDDLTGELLRRHLVEPAEERALAAALARLTAIDHPVSQAVRAQYEDRPYPRWRTVRRPRPRRFADAVAAAVHRPDLAGTLDVDAPRILIAGCGTGRHAILTATRYRGARVLAVDLSLTSLGYAARTAHRLGVDNVEFAQADILELGGLADRFDVVECTGVLHHLADPEAGWASLRRLLRPGGLMKVGVYSRRGRSMLDPLAARIAARGLEPTVAGIRATRRIVRDLPPSVPASRLTRGPDFYAVSGCRDLFFPVHEDRFDLPRIGRALETLDLQFLGFELPSRRVRALYHARVPDDGDGVRLDHWHRLEETYPYLFAAMYRLWARAPVRRAGR